VNSINARSKRVSKVMGLDLGDRFSRYAVLDGRGALIDEGQVATTREGLEELFGREGRMRVVIETGTHSPWVSRLGTAAGHEVIVANARKVKLITSNRNKRDSVDAVYLARLGRADVKLLHPVRHRSEQTQQHRVWLLARDTAVATRTKLINHVRGVVKSLGERLPVCSAEVFERKVASHIPPTLQAAMTPMLSLIASLTETIRNYDKQIAAISHRHYPIVERLQQVNGVGPITSLAYVLTLEDPHRFASSRTVGAYLGLVPGTHESGEQMPQMRITKEGDVFVRRLLINAAQHILGPFGVDSDLRRHGQRIALRGGKIAKKRAVVAVARKIAVLLHKLWLTSTDYDPLFTSRHMATNVA
jgi:transposase